MYVYRYDSLNSLRAQRSDPYLRAARDDGDRKYYPHWQCQHAHANLGAGEAVYRLSFWKDWASAIGQVKFAQNDTPVVLQRLHIGHKVLRQFERGQDQYLTEPGRNDAWLFWATLPVSPDCGAFSELGISHQDLEALVPGVGWMPLAQAPCFADDRYQGLLPRLVSADPGNTSPYYPAAQMRTTEAGTQLWVVIRQPYGPWSALMNHNAGMARIVARLCAELGEVPLDRVRWVWALENDGGDQPAVRACEFFPRWRRPPTPRPWYRFWQASSADEPTVPFEVAMEQCRWFDVGTVTALYRDLGLMAVLQGNRQWRYPDGFLDTVDPGPFDPAYRHLWPTPRGGPEAA